MDEKPSERRWFNTVGNACPNCCMKLKLFKISGRYAVTCRHCNFGATLSNLYEVTNHEMPTTRQT